MSHESELLLELAKLRAENERLKANKSATSGLIKISEKGAVSVYGLGQFPVTLYKTQWLALLDRAQSIQDFIVANDPMLKVKPPKAPKQA